MGEKERMGEDHMASEGFVFILPTVGVVEELTS